MVSIAFRVSEAEAKQVRDAALNEGTTVSNFCRQKIFGGDANLTILGELSQLKNLNTAILNILIEMAKQSEVEIDTRQILIEAYSDK